METPSPDSQNTASVEVTPAARVNWNVTSLLSLVALLVGIGLGYTARPLLEAPPAATVAVVTTPVVGNSAAAASNKPPTILSAVVANTRHFKGDPNAPITVIEFSDFQ